MAATVSAETDGSCRPAGRPSSVPTRALAGAVVVVADGVGDGGIAKAYNG
jgi:hypothetical protein